MKKAIFVLVFFSIYPLTLMGQDYTKLIEVLPPSPSSANLGLHGNSKVRLSSGMASVNIPLGELVSKSLKIPISLNYSSSGFKVDEISSRQGIGWNMLVGGVVTRTVYGSVDENSNFLSPPAEFPRFTRSVIDDFFLPLQANENQYWDSQKDLFSFSLDDGTSCEFVLDNNKKPVLLNNLPIKIECDFESSDWTFRITNGSGVQYYFGGAGGDATEYTTKLQSGYGCGKQFRTSPATAWYVTKIIHPNNDSIFFKYGGSSIYYVSGISQTLFARNTQQQPAPCAVLTAPGGPPNMDNSFCISRLMNNCSYVKEICSSSGGKILFEYAGGRKDLTDDVLLTAVKFFQPGKSTLYKSYELSYDQVRCTGIVRNSQVSGDNSLYYRPFLIGLIEKSPLQEAGRQYSFSYDRMNQVPPRLSYSQDHFGYYNGADNSVLVPAPPYLQWRPFFPDATANREPNGDKGSIGMLKKIVYPTGGYDSIVYEANKVFKTVTEMPNDTIVSVYSQSTSNSLGAESSKTFSIKVSGYVKINGWCVFDPSLGDEDPLHQKAVITVSNIKGGQVYFKMIDAGTSFNELFFADTGTYSLSVDTHGEATTGSADVYYKNKSIVTKDKDEITGGFRVSKMFNIAGGNTHIKRYRYSSLNDTTSSGREIYTPSYDNLFISYTKCPSLDDPLYGNTSWVDCSFQGYEFYSMYSNTQNSLFLFSSPSPVSYSAVQESDGDSFENGGLLHEYFQFSDIPGLSYGKNIMGVPYISNSWKNGQEYRSLAFKKNKDIIIPVKEIRTVYKEDDRFNQELKSYITNARYAPTCLNEVPDQTETDAYDVYVYSQQQKWFYVDSVITRNYDTEGNKYVEESVKTEYENVAYALPTKNTVITSDNKKQIMQFHYPFNSSFTGMDENIRNAMISKNMISPVLRVDHYKENTLLKSSMVKYSLFNNLILPSISSRKILNNEETPLVFFTSYNNDGNIQEQSFANNVKEVYLWGYNNLYPVAKIIGTDFNNAVSKVDQSILNSPLDDQTLRSELNKLRSIPNALVTTYTYSPLVGMTSETDVNGNTTYYEYDSFGRLACIKDKDKNIIKKICYSYNGQVINCN